MRWHAIIRVSFLTLVPSEKQVSFTQTLSIPVTTGGANLKVSLVQAVSTGRLLMSA